MTISQRRDRLRQRLRADGLDAILVTRLVNVRYLSGFTGSNAALLIRADGETPVLATDGRYRTQAGQQVPDAEIVIERACGPFLAGRAAADGVGRLGFESHAVTVEGFDALAKQACDTELVRAAGIVESLREVKDAGEVALLRLACEAADAALAESGRQGRPAARAHRAPGGPRAGVADVGQRGRRGVVRNDRGGRSPTPRFRTTGPPMPSSRRVTSSRSTSGPWWADTTQT